MTVNDDMDYGPLGNLIGAWKGDRGMDIAPEPDGAENNPFYETLVFTAAGDVTNAESQVLAAVHYRQTVHRKSTGKVFHDETGYWMWDARAGIVMHALTIPRGVSVLAGGAFDGENDDGAITLEVSASLNDRDWNIVQSPFMQNNARTKAFHQRVTVRDTQLSYAETTIVDIYGKEFEHTDENELIRQ